MIEKPIASIIHHFSSIEDSRVDRQKKHQLQDIFFIALCAVICGADNWVAIEEFGKAKIDWFTKLLGLQHGIPAHAGQSGLNYSNNAEQIIIIPTGL